MRTCVQAQRAARVFCAAEAREALVSVLYNVHATITQVK